MSKYEDAAKKFCEKNGIKIKVTFKEKRKNPWNLKDYQANWEHNIYTIRVSRDGKSFSEEFVDSKTDTEAGREPSLYDILCCLDTEDPGEFEDFCEENGYEIWDEDTGKYNADAKRIYKAVKKEYENCCRVLGVELLDELRHVENGEYEGEVTA